MFLDLDANATYAADERIQVLIAQAMDTLGNPSSVHRAGQRARAAVEEARQSVRELVGAAAEDQIVFTSGATEANNTVVSAAAGLRSGHLVSTQIEHPSILAPLARAAQRGCEVRLVAPEPSGEILPEGVAKVLTSDTALVSVMMANNETGIINPVEEIARRARSLSPRALVHSDLSQIVGKQKFSFSELGIDIGTISGHKIGALSGVGALVLRRGIEVAPLVVGGSQEMKARGGTENVLGILSLGIAARMVSESINRRIVQMSALRDRCEEIILKGLPGCEVNGRGYMRLPNTSSIFVEGVRGDDLVVALDLEKILVSSGAACSSGKPEPSHVLLAMGQDEERVRSTIRVSFRADQYRQDAERAADALVRVVMRMRDERGGAAHAA